MMCASLLLIFTTLMLAGGIITFLGAELFHKALKNENNEGIIGHIDSNLQALQTFTAGTVQELKDKTKEEVGSGLNTIIQEVDGTVHKTVTKVKNTINATSILNQTEYLGNATLEIKQDLNSVNTSLVELKHLQVEVNNTLADIRDEINRECPNPCPVDTSGLNFNPDFRALDELQTQADQIAKTQDISQLIADAKNKFNNVSNDVDQKVASNIEKAKNETEKIRTQLFSELTRIDNASDPFNKSLEEGRSYLRDNSKEIAKISDYIWYGCIGVGCTIMLLVFFYYMGVLFGMCGERPGRDAACCNRGTGANLLYFGVFVSAVFSWIVMLIVAVMFLTGGLTYTMFCRYVDDGIENVGTFETVIQDSFGWNVSQAFGVKNLSISGMFQNCKENQAIYSALHLDNRFNIDNIVNTSDIQKQVKEMTDVSFDLNNITLMSDELKSQLTDFLNSGLENITFSEYRDELGKPVIGNRSSYLDTLARDLEEASKAPTKSALNETAQKIITLKNTKLQQVDTEKTNLATALDRLEEHVNLTYLVDALINGIESAQDSYNTQKDQIVRESLSDATNIIMEVINTTAENAKNMVKNDIGKCRPLYDAAQNVVDAGCEMGVDSFNSIWFGLGWAAFFYIPCFICAAVLAALYMKIGPYQDRPKDHFDDPNHDTYNGYVGAYHQEDIPLTSQQNMQDHINGKFNGAFSRNEGIDYQRGPRSSGYGYDPHSAHGSSHHDGGYGLQQRPPDYDELARQGYIGRDEGGYPRSHHY